MSFEYEELSDYEQKQRQEKVERLAEVLELTDSPDLQRFCLDSQRLLSLLVSLEDTLEEQAQEISDLKDTVNRLERRKLDDPSYDPYY